MKLRCVLFREITMLCVIPENQTQKKMARKKSESKLPSFDELIIPTVKALIKLGGSGSIEEINTNVYEIYNISDEILNISHGENGRS